MSSMRRLDMAARALLSVDNLWYSRPYTLNAVNKR